MKQLKKKDDNKVVIGKEWTERDDQDLSCPYCNRVLIKLIDSSGLNPSLFCSTCKIEHLPQTVRKKSKLGTQRKEVEPAVSTTPGIPDISIHKEPPMRGGFAELQKKGLRIKDYHTTEKE